MTVLWIVLGVVVVLAIAVAVSYNRFVRQRNLVQESWRQIDVELKRRHDLIPNLVETVKGYATHEREVFDAVTRARAQAAAPGSSPAQQAQQEGILGQALRPALRGRRGLPGPQGEHQLPRAAARADRDRGPHRRRPPVLQRQRPRPEHPGRVGSPPTWSPASSASTRRSTSRSRTSRSARPRPSTSPDPGRRTESAHAKRSASGHRRGGAGGRGPGLVHRRRQRKRQRPGRGRAAPVLGLARKPRRPSRPSTRERPAARASSAGSSRCLWTGPAGRTPFGCRSASVVGSTRRAASCWSSREGPARQVSRSRTGSWSWWGRTQRAPTASWCSTSAAPGRPPWTARRCSARWASRT